MPRPFSSMMRMIHLAIYALVILQMTACGVNESDPSIDGLGREEMTTSDSRKADVTDDLVMGVVRNYLQKRGMKHLPPHEIILRSEDRWVVTLTVDGINSEIYVDPKERKVVEVVRGY